MHKTRIIMLKILGEDIFRNYYKVLLEQRSWKKERKNKIKTKESKKKRKRDDTTNQTFDYVKRIKMCEKLRETSLDCEDDWWKNEIIRREESN